MARRRISKPVNRSGPVSRRISDNLLLEREAKVFLSAEARAILDSRMSALRLGHRYLAPVPDSPSAPSSWLAGTLRARAGANGSAAQTAVAFSTVLRAIGVALEPVLGNKSATLLYKRSLLRNVTAHPWLIAAPKGIQEDAGLKAVEDLFSQQSSADAIDAGTAILQSLYDLLIDLAGESLTERLLRSVWSNYVPAEGR